MFTNKMLSQGTLNTTPSTHKAGCIVWNPNTLGFDSSFALSCSPCMDRVQDIFRIVFMCAEVNTSQQCTDKSVVPGKVSKVQTLNPKT